MLYTKIVKSYIKNEYHQELAHEKFGPGQLHHIECFHVFSKIYSILILDYVRLFKGQKIGSAELEN